jgi:DNA primase
MSQQPIGEIPHSAGCWCSACARRKQESRAKLAAHSNAGAAAQPSLKPQATRFARIPCPVHGGADANCEVRFNSEGRPYFARCYSYNCSRRAILAALSGRINTVLAQATSSLDREKARAAAWRIWNFSQQIRGTLAERYLRDIRGITAAPPACLKFNPNVFHHHTRTGDFYFPALIACVETSGARFAGIYRTWLDPSTPDFKLRLEPRKAALGTAPGAIVPVTRSLTNPTVVLVEGLEDALSIMQAAPHFMVWATLGAGNFRSVQLPNCVHTVILAGDNDRPGQKAIAAAACHFYAQGREVRVVYPPPGIKDFNDLLRTFA